MKADLAPSVKPSPLASQELHHLEWWCLIRFRLFVCECHLQCLMLPWGCLLHNGTISNICSPLSQKYIVECNFHSPFNIIMKHLFALAVRAIHMIGEAFILPEIQIWRNIGNMSKTFHYLFYHINILFNTCRPCGQMSQFYLCTDAEERNSSENVVLPKMHRPAKRRQILLTHCNFRPWEPKYYSFKWQK